MTNVLDGFVSSALLTAGVVRSLAVLTFSANHQYEPTPTTIPATIRKATTPRMIHHHRGRRLARGAGA